MLPFRRLLSRQNLSNVARLLTNKGWGNGEKCLVMPAGGGIECQSGGGALSPIPSNPKPSRLNLLPKPASSCFHGPGFDSLRPFRPFFPKPGFLFHGYGFDSMRPFSCCVDETSNKPDPVTGLTPKMVGLLKCLGVAIKPEAHRHGVNIFKKLFLMDKTVQRMFPKFACDDMCGLDENPDFHKHVDAVMKSILYMMESSGSVPDMKSTLALQVKIHKDLCIPDRHFITFGYAINEYLKETLGAKYSEDVECAVAYFWKFVASEMTAKPHQKCPKCGCTVLKRC
ncbi:uncharacterized protein LOC103506299 [Diaphorina citri]|uniref:Uncharacterized protein LOC103506299 n=1 Tax=Diaphorina citri TaxID=121845 RepID=A0A1S3CW24_DIACI|nr:uncharacterized protein LOC103506299 [Diaphorina citri]